MFSRAVLFKFSVFRSSSPHQFVKKLLCMSHRHLHVAANTLEALGAFINHMGQITWTSPFSAIVSIAERLVVVVKLPFMKAY